jgi:hypothetical protein
MAHKYAASLLIYDVSGTLQFKVPMNVQYEWTKTSKFAGWQFWFDAPTLSKLQEMFDGISNQLKWQL